MKLRTQLVLAFLLLSVLPLSGLVLYSYATSTAAFRRAVEEESRQLTEGIEHRMASVKRDLRVRLQRVSALPVSRQALEMAEGEEPSEELFRQLLAQMGDAAQWIESMEFIPEPQLSPLADPRAEGAEPGLSALWLHIYREGGEQEGDEGLRISMMRHRPERRELAQVRERQRQRLEEASDRLERKLKDLEQELEVKSQEAEASAEALSRGETDTHSAMDAALEAGMLEASVRSLELRRERMGLLLGDEFSSAVTAGEEIVGFLKAAVSAPQLIQEVLRRTRRAQGEVPFAFDGEGSLYASSHEDLARLESLRLDVGECRPEAGLVSTRSVGDWVVVTRQDPDSSLLFGIARPIGSSLSEIRSTSVRNFGLGVGMIGLALLGILPLSGRMTRNLNRLAADVDRLADGDLDVRTEVRARDEIGQLARSFNHLAQDLREHQDRLLEQERRSREQEVARRLLEAENERKSEELEDARRFQLSLLPKELPQHPSVEVAVFMRTATEVGGDYYDFHLAEDGGLTVAVGDATGHGAKAGTMVTAIKSLFVSEAGPESLSGFLQDATRTIRGMELGRMSMGLVLARIRDRRLAVAAAGMPPVLLCRGGRVEELAFEGVPLGAALESRYREREAALEPGDAVLLMSDGLPELLNGEGEPFGYSRVRRIFSGGPTGSAQELIFRLAAAVPDWTGETPPSDDVTFVVLRVKPDAGSTAR